MTEAREREQLASIQVRHLVEALAPPGATGHARRLRWIELVKADASIMALVETYPKILRAAAITKGKANDEATEVLAAAVRDLAAPLRYMAGSSWKEGVAHGEIEPLSPQRRARFEKESRKSEAGRTRMKVHRGRRPGSPNATRVERLTDMEESFRALPRVDQDRVLQPRQAKGFVLAHIERWGIGKSQAYEDWERFRTLLAEREHL